MLRHGEDLAAARSTPRDRPLSHRLPAHREARHQSRRRRRPSKRSALYCRAMLRLPCRSTTWSWRSNGAGGRRQRQRRQPQLRRPHLHPLLPQREGGQPLHPPRLLLEHERDLEQRRPARVALRRQMLRQQRQRILTVREVRRHRPLRPLQQLDEPRLPRQVPRSTTRFTKYPTVPASFDCQRFARGEPTARSSCPVCLPRSAWKAASRVRKSVPCCARLSHRSSDTNSAGSRSRYASPR